MKRVIIFTFVILNLFNVAIAQNTVGDNIFSSNTVHDVYFNFSQVSYWDTLTANYTADVYTRCDISFDGVYYFDVGVKMKGNSSYNNPSIKKSFKVDMNEYVSGQNVDGLKKFNLNNGFKDPSFLREKLMLDFCYYNGIPAPRCTYARLFINNQLWGLYMFVEEVDKNFLEDRFINKKGNLFKGDPTGDLKWYGTSPSLYYPKYELKTNETQNDWSGLVHLIDEINNTPSANLHDSLEAVMNTIHTLKAWAASNIFVNLDSYLGSGHNYYVYHDSLSLKWNYIVWDVNEAFGNFNMGMSISQMENLSMYWISNPVTNRPLYNKMVADQSYKTAYTQIICSMLDNTFSNSFWDPKIDSIVAIISPYVSADPNKFFTYQNFLDNIYMNITVMGTPGGNNLAGIKSFIQNRRNFLVGELLSNNCTVGINENEVLNEFGVFPNPASEILNVFAKTPIEKIEIIDLQGSIIFNKINDKTLDVSINIGEFSSGMYFIRINNAGTRKWIKE